MSMLRRVGSGSIQQIAKAVAAALDTNVTIVDTKLFRVAGTGPYIGNVEKYAPNDSAYAKVLKLKKTILIENPRKDFYCQGCSAKDKCIETFEICTPIMWQKEVVGVLGIFAYDEEQKQKMQRKKTQYLDFLHRMSELIASSVGEMMLYEELDARNKELSIVIENVSQGIICTDSRGTINHINERARELLAISAPLDNLPGTMLKDIWPDALLFKALREGRDYLDNEEHYRKGKHYKSLLSTIKLIYKNKRITAAVATLNDAEDIQKSAYRVRERNDFSFDDLIGNSTPFYQAKKRAIQVADHDSTVLIEGESGTGKELFARAIHNASSRADHPFIGVNCSAIPETLLESELFGYEAGAFTGANKKGKPGKMELAHNGTFFLDEIGDMPLYLQAKILRVLQERQLVKIGGTKAKNINIRIIAATNKNLYELMERKMFREDLFYRLNVIPLKLPPLRERIDDIPVFVEYFLKIYNKRLCKQVMGFSDETLRFMLTYEWPGNVRELENVIQFGISIAESDYIQLYEIKEHFQAIPDNSTAKSLSELVKEFEHQVINSKLNMYGWDEKGKKKTASELKLSRATLYRKISQ